MSSETPGGTGAEDGVLNQKVQRFQRYETPKSYTLKRTLKPKTLNPKP